MSGLGSPDGRSIRNAELTIAALGDVPLEQAGVYNDDLLRVQRSERIHESC
jgi:hypothetical protein